MSAAPQQRASRMRRACLLFLVTATLGSFGHTCTFAVGYFHQVTAIRGRVVGKNLPLFQFAWFRQSFSVASASLTLYEFRSEPAKTENRKRIATATTNSQGDFDFGPIPKGHYSLDVAVPGSDVMGGWFDVEVTDVVKPTAAITLDVSPISPDCTGGHEFIERKAVNAQTH